MVKRPTHIHHDEHAQDPTKPRYPSADMTDKQLEEIEAAEKLKIEKRDKIFADLDRIRQLVEAKAEKLGEAVVAEINKAIESLKSHVG